jgi:hypothetical protein
MNSDENTFNDSNNYETRSNQRRQYRRIYRKYRIRAKLNADINNKETLKDISKLPRQTIDEDKPMMNGFFNGFSPNEYNYN